MLPEGQLLQLLRLLRLRLLLLAVTPERFNRACPRPCFEFSDREGVKRSLPAQVGIVDLRTEAGD